MSMEFVEVESGSIEVVEVSLQGIPGVAGKSAYERAVDLGIIPNTMSEETWLSSATVDKTFVWFQESPLAIWDVPHNLNKYPAVRVTDTNGYTLLSETQDIDPNVVRVTHGVAMSGFVICN